MNLDDYLSNLEAEFLRHANPKIANGQRAYVKNRFDFFGLKTLVRREVQKPFLEGAHLPSKKEALKIVSVLWGNPKREYHYFAQELLYKYVKNLEKKDMVIIEAMVINQSWWDTVDFIATKLMASYFKIYPMEREAYVHRWLTSGNIWLQRSALLFQLKYKDKMDTDLLSQTINFLLGSKEFFINKAIGWTLREYSRTNPEWVVAFVNRTDLSGLSRKEALRLLTP